MFFFDSFLIIQSFVIVVLFHRLQNISAIAQSENAAVRTPSPRASTPCLNENVNTGPRDHARGPLLPRGRMNHARAGRPRGSRQSSRRNHSYSLRKLPKVNYKE